MERKPYSGNGKPFVYAMYAHDDKEGAEETIHQLWEKEFEVWPSERFDRWKIEKSALFVLFLSPAAAADEAVNRAINYAVQRDHPMLTVYLAQTALSPAQRLLLNSQQGIMRDEAATEEEYFEQLFGSKLLNQLTVTRAQICAARVTTWSSIFGILGATALAIVLALGGGAKVPEDSLLSELGFSGRMGQIQGIFLYGDQVKDEKSEKAYLGRIHVGDGETTSPAIVYNDGESALFGAIQDVSDLGQLSNLKQLSLAGNAVEDITPLFSLKNLTFLDLTGNPVKDLAGIDSLKRLETLNISSTQVSDLAPLYGCETLRTVYLDEAQFARFSEDALGAPFTLTVVGPAEELRNLSCHIFAGPEEYDRPNDVYYGVFIQAKYMETYTSYGYVAYKDGAALPITQIEDVDINNDGAGEKMHLLIKISDMQRYNPDSVYTLKVSYGAYSATYRMWHKYDETGQNPNNGVLIAAEGFKE